MESISTYAVLGVPDSLATSIALLCLALALAPWFPGIEIGPLKVPRLPEGAGTSLRYVGAVLFGISVAAFLKLWLPSHDKIEFSAYICVLKRHGIDNPAGACVPGRGDRQLNASEKQELTFDIPAPGIPIGAQVFSVGMTGESNMSMFSTTAAELRGGKILATFTPSTETYGGFNSKLTFVVHFRK